jgi:hypothetical protein
MQKHDARGSKILPNCTCAASALCCSGGIATCLEKSAGVSKMYTRESISGFAKGQFSGSAHPQRFRLVVSRNFCASSSSGLWIYRSARRARVNEFSLSLSPCIYPCERVRRPRARTIVGGRGATTQFFTPARPPCSPRIMCVTCIARASSRPAAILQQ